MSRSQFIMLVSLGTAVVTSEAGAHPMDPNILQIRQSDAGRVWLTWATSIPGVKGLPRGPAHCVPSGSEEHPPALSGARSTWHVALQCGSSGLKGARFVLPEAATKTDTIVRVLRPEPAPWTTVVRAKDDTFVLPERGAQDGWTLAGRYLTLGVEHILLGIDHLAFVLGLFLLVRTRRALLWTITAFTAGHSVTLALSTLEVIHLRSAPVEVLIALSIVLLAREIGRRGAHQESVLQNRGGTAAAGFGLLHGFGFAGALRDLGVPAEQAWVALGSFNLGVELGQLVFVFGLVGLGKLYRQIPQFCFSPSPRWLGYGLGVVATVWVMQRTAHLGV